MLVGRVPAIIPREFAPAGAEWRLAAAAARRQAQPRSSIARPSGRVSKGLAVVGQALESSTHDMGGATCRRAKGKQRRHGWPMVLT